MKKPVLCLLVDEHSSDQQLFIETLQSLAPGSVCYVATDATEASRILSHGQRYPDFIFINVDMLNINNKELVERIKRMEELRGVPVVIHSEDIPTWRIEELYKLGVSGVHLEALNRAHFKKILAKYLN